MEWSLIYCIRVHLGRPRQMICQDCIGYYNKTLWLWSAGDSITWGVTTLGFDKNEGKLSKIHTIYSTEIMGICFYTTDCFHITMRKERHNSIWYRWKYYMGQNYIGLQLSVIWCSKLCAILHTTKACIRWAESPYDWGSQLKCHFLSHSWPSLLVPTHLTVHTSCRIITMAK